MIENVERFSFIKRYYFCLYNFRAETALERSSRLSDEKKAKERRAVYLMLPIKEKTVYPIKIKRSIKNNQ